MSEEAAASSPPTMAYLPPDGDPVFGFLTTKWIEPPNLVSTCQETAKELESRLLMEATYRQNATATSWYRYITLGRHPVDGNTFDMIWNEFEVDPLRVHCLIWYNYMYHVDRNLDIPSKLDSWATKRSQIYLAIHAPTVLTVDTTRTTWKALTIVQAISTHWTTVGTSKQRNASSPNQRPQKLQTSIKNRSVQSILPFKRASAGLADTSTPTISEEGETEQTRKLPETMEAERAEMDKQTFHGFETDSQKTASIGKTSAIIPNLDVPLNDGTHRITLRWKVDFDLSNTSKQAANLTSRIYELIDGMFSDDDGLLYKWGKDDLNHFNSISQMTPAEVRAFISPSITILPTQSTIIVPLRFGFSGKTPSAWRNKNSTKMFLESQNVTLSISNSKTTSGRLVIAGYILLKAPMTTHRIRYLQYLRCKLPETTPHFDILLHRKTPLEQNINHLVIQCGEKHVHPLSQALLTVLTGYRSPVYIPRFAFADMSPDQAIKLFETHDQYIKSLRSISLFPMLTNLDTLRTEHFPDGNTLERSTREWATGIMSIDGTESAKCDVVNGGLDQKAYLLVSPKFEEAARHALEEYRRRIFPFTLREARFRDSIGPPTVIHVKSKVDANIKVLESLSSEDFWQQAPASVKAPSPANNQFSLHSDSVSHTSTASEPSFPSRPPTPLESLRKRYQGDELSHNNQQQADETTTTTDTTRSHGISEKSSLQHARFKELEATILRQQKDIQRSNKASSDKLQQIESQLQSQLDAVKSEMKTQITSLEEKMLISMQQQVDNGNSMKEINSKIERLTEALALLLDKSSNNHGKDHAHRDQDSAAYNIDDASMKTSSTGSSQEVVSSPQHKRLRSANHTTEDINDEMEFGTPASSDQETEESTSTRKGRDDNVLDNEENDIQGSETPQESEAATQISTNLFDQNADARSQSHNLAEVTADLEARYNKPNAPGGGYAT